jgi:hypothetical protein
MSYMKGRADNMSLETEEFRDGRNSGDSILNSLTPWGIPLGSDLTLTFKKHITKLFRRFISTKCFQNSEFLH